MDYVIIFIVTTWGMSGMVCKARLGSLPNELGNNKIGLAASKAAFA